MTQKTNPYFPQFKNSQKIFKKIVKKFFIKNFLQDQAKLHFFLIEQTVQKQNSYFDENLVKEEDLLAQNMSAIKVLIQECLLEKTINCRYFMEEVEVNQNGRIKYRGFLILVPPRLNEEHSGNFLLKCLVQEMAKIFSQCQGELDYKDEEWVVQNALTHIEARVKSLLQAMFNPLNLDYINDLSGEHYEKAECISNMTFLPNGVVEKLKMDDWVYHFEDISFSSENSRLLRKLLQITQEELYLVLGKVNERKPFQVLGICRKDSLKQIEKNEKGETIPCIHVEIKKHMQWKLFLNEKYIMTCKNGHYIIENSDDSYEKIYLAEKIQNYFGKRDEGYDALIGSIMKSQNQWHGTMLVIMDSKNAHEEAERLSSLNYGFKEKEPHIQPEINHINAIDGSVIIDIDGKVHGIGMILDGISWDKGELATGARHNSAKKYCSYLRNSKREEQVRAMIYIVSEDGPTDIVYV